ncbi:TlyA family RNA methyltransferase [Sulfidibacter corallicola]|uniref:TlyA family RNA methyltransferase n=1 Tax=Sulfidibacter corallicola TaxID=2818388 RepID=A0A8A4TV54_SULCO|nr:TlyA family RNA methyltransferase [Sulfidibacter corallicola]QTD53004.1 TlyA family RNA methyltransferase [Sulfidibacter corallicola]
MKPSHSKSRPARSQDTAASKSDSRSKAKPVKARIDQLMVDRGLATSRDEASRWIMAGLVLMEDQRIDKPGTKISETASIRVKHKAHAYVSRGGLKLEGALNHWGIDVEGTTALDLGASTGGFTDCLLKRGAKKVYAVDVGTNQLDYRLRADTRVISLEQTHAKELDTELVPDAIEVLTVDVSFTSLTYVLPFALPLLQKGAACLCLFKPQFEVPRSAVGEGGIVTDETAIRQALTEGLTWFEEHGLQVVGKIKSPIKGREGNQEYLLWARFTDTVKASGKS